MFKAFNKSWKHTNDPKDKACNKAFIECFLEAYYDWWKGQDDSAPVEYIKNFKGT